MSIAAWFQNTLGRLAASRCPTPRGQARLDANQTGDASGRPSDLERTLAGAWLEACDAGCLDTPLDVRDADAWDEYWDQHIKVGLLELGMSDMMSSDSGLVDLLSRRGAETILCAGNGMSMEAVSLALFGFHVTALDIAKVPALVLARAFANPEDPVRQINRVCRSRPARHSADAGAPLRRDGIAERRRLADLRDGRSAGPARVSRPI
jgi:hypothetical protein